MIFIAKDYNGKTIGIVSAADQKSANAYWQGQGTNPHSTIEFIPDQIRENEKMGYVTPILTTAYRQVPKDFGRDTIEIVEVLPS